jgi:hypothetical protein
MNFGAFKRSLSKPSCPAGASPALEALRWAGKDDRKRAHDIVMAHEGDVDCDWVHAHLHRVEGDLPNARWWYKQAKRPASAAALQAEWNAIVEELLKEST